MSAQWAEQTAALSGSSDPSPQHATAFAAADVEGTFIRTALGIRSERKREHCPRACETLVRIARSYECGTICLFVAHHSLNVFELDTTSYYQTVLDGSGKFSANEHGFPSLRAAEGIVGVDDGPIDTILLW